MRYLATIMSEVVIIFIAVWIFDSIFLAGLVTILITFIVYHLWDSYFNYLEEEK